MGGTALSSPDTHVARSHPPTSNRVQRAHRTAAMTSLSERQGFLPRLEGTFLSIFHPLQGPRVLFQMPEDLFYDPEKEAAHSTSSASSQQRFRLEFSTLSDYVIPKNPLCGRMIICNISSCPDGQGRRHHYKVMGVPMLLEHEQKYERNHFIFNLCFVFQSNTDTRSYEPIVHKCARSLRMLEEEQSFVSRLDNLPRLYAIVEQLYEEMNSFYEVFIALPEASNANRFDAARKSCPDVALDRNLTRVDPAELDELLLSASGPLARVREQTYGMNAKADSPSNQGVRMREKPSGEPSSTIPDQCHASLAYTRSLAGEQTQGLGSTVRDAINLKLFPSFVQPPPVHDWDVPVLLLDMSKFMNDSWDLTLVRLIPFLNGTSHVRRIAQLADTDVLLVKQCVQHLLYYSFAMLIDIFQFSNIYVLRPQVAPMLSDPHIESECASYVMLPGCDALPGPVLWHMYSMLRYGRTLHDWIGLLGNQVQAVDIRRFITFGVIKGFVRRVHQYPIYSSYQKPLQNTVDTLSSPLFAFPPDSMSFAQSNKSLSYSSGQNVFEFSLDPNTKLNGFANATASRLQDVQLSNKASQRSDAKRRLSTAIDVASVAHGTFSDDAVRKRAASPSVFGSAPVEPKIPVDLPSLLDGSRCDDELCVQFGMSWTDLQRWFAHLSTQPVPFDFTSDKETSPKMKPTFSRSSSNYSYMYSNSHEHVDAISSSHNADDVQHTARGLISIVAI